MVVFQGDVVQMDSVMATVSCSFDFSDYPFDRHVCPFSIHSYFDDIDSVVFTGSLSSAAKGIFYSSICSVVK